MKLNVGPPMRRSLLVTTTGTARTQVFVVSEPEMGEIIRGIHQVMDDKRVGQFNGTGGEKAY